MARTTATPAKAAPAKATKTPVKAAPKKAAPPKAATAVAVVAKPVIPVAPAVATVVPIKSTGPKPVVHVPVEVEASWKDWHRALRQANAVISRRLTLPILG